MNLPVQKWIRISLFNLFLVAFLGMIMRYKIVYPLSFVDQRNLLHAHSHFAFAGWITQSLMSLLVYHLYKRGRSEAFREYRNILYANLITAYGMLLTFPFTGYGLLSIIFSTLSIFVSYWFGIKYWIDLNKTKPGLVSSSWFKSAIVCNAISSLGAFSLAYMLATKNIHPEWYLACIYFFLHFQYNGWFFFSCMGLFDEQLEMMGVEKKKLKGVFLLFVIACGPAYFLSALWLPIGTLAYLLVILSVFLQLTGWVWTLQLIKIVKQKIRQTIPPFAGTLFWLSAIALSAKLLLQAGSVIPSLSQLAFGFRPIIIGYLHLVLLGVISLFLLAYITAYKIIRINKITKHGIIVFVAGIIINELLLMIQGIADIRYEPLPYVNVLLLATAIILLTGTIMINYGQRSFKV
jgi:hypothetical protein